VVDRWPLLVEDVVVGVDAEWDSTSEATVDVAVVQLATVRGSFVIDMLAATPTMVESLKAFFEDPKQVQKQSKRSWQPVSTGFLLFTVEVAPQLVLHHSCMFHFEPQWMFHQ
jgi:hypothetical protein